jgi:hypothetical protein
MKSVYFSAYLIYLLIYREAMAHGTEFRHYLETTTVSENNTKIIVHALTPIAIDILPGGITWPTLSLDEKGHLYIGNAILNPASGISMTHPTETLALPYDIGVIERFSGFQFRQGKADCLFSLQQLGLMNKRPAAVALKKGNIKFSSTANALLALVTQFGPDGRVSNYIVEKIDLARCIIPFQRNMGNPDLLVELGHSVEGGWWVTGSIEQTLMQSDDGQHWRNVPLPQELSSLVSAYLASPQEIWLAAILPEEKATSPYLIVYSKDGGQRWKNVSENDPVLKRLPSGWLAGQKRGNRQQQ